MTHKTGRPNHQLPTRLRVELPNAPLVRPGPPAGSPRARLEPLSGGLIKWLLIPVGSAASLPGRPPRSQPLLLASNSSAWTNSWEGAGRAEPVNQSLTPRRGLARGGSGGQSLVRGARRRPPPRVGSRPRASGQGA